MWAPRVWRRGPLTLARVGVLAVAAGLLLAAALLGYSTPLLAQEGDGAAAEASGTGTGIRLSDLSEQPTHTTVDRFTVEVTKLSAAVAYEVIVSSDNAAGLGIGGCGTASQTRSVTGVEAQDLTFFVYACAVSEGTLRAAVRRSGADAADASVSQALTVLAIPEGAPAGVRGAPAASAASRGATRVGTPGIVSNVHFPDADRKATSVKAKWKPPSDGGRPLTGYGVLFWRKGDPDPPWNQAVSIGVTNEQTFTGLQPATTYKFRIHACNGPDSCGWWTHPPVEVTTRPAPPTAPPPPSHTATPTPTPTATPTKKPTGPDVPASPRGAQLRQRGRPVIQLSGGASRPPDLARGQRRRRRADLSARASGGQRPDVRRGHAHGGRHAAGRRQSHHPYLYGDRRGQKDGPDILPCHGLRREG